MKLTILPSLSLFAVIISFALLFPLPVSANANCLTLYNGGITNQQFCPTPIPQNPISTALPKQTVSGQPVYPASQTSQTPNTGPDSWSLVGLVAFAGLGLLLRNKAKLDNNGKIM